MKDIIPFKDIITDNTLCIFTDASCTQVSKNTIVCPGYIMTYGNQIYGRSGYQILTHSTNNRGELYAILMGISDMIISIHHINPEKIILFSDSRISVLGIREWIYDWFKNINDGKLYSNSGKLVANQDIILQIVNLIQSNQIRINILHTKGHQKFIKIPTVEYVNTFKDINKVPYNIDFDVEFYKFIMYFNNEIDHYTRSKLQYHLNNDPPQILNMKQDMPLTYNFNGFNEDLYRSLTSI